MSTKNEPTKVFISYAAPDEKYLEELDKHLSQLRKDGLIDTWDARSATPGEDERDITIARLEAAKIILLLVSADYLASPLHDSDVTRVMERDRARVATVVPILIRPCDWTNASFGKLRALPDPATPVSTWKNRDAAFLKIAQAIRLLTQGATLDEVEADSDRALVRPYIDLLAKHLGAMEFIPRTIHSDLRGAARVGDYVDPFETLVDGNALYLEGWSGRGKTMVLRLLARKAIEKGEDGYVPIFLRADRMTSTVPQAILEELAQATDAFKSEAELTTWMNDNAVLLLIDDWHQATNSGRRRIEQFLDTLQPARMIVVIAGSGKADLKIRRLRQARVDRYSQADRDAVILAFLGHHPNANADWILKKVPVGFEGLLLEPVILDKCLSLVLRSPGAGFRIPLNVPDLLDSLLERMLSSRHDNARQRALEVTNVCVQLAKGGRRIQYRTIVEATRSVGLEGNASAFAEDLEASGIFRREGTTYEFEHDIWRRGFEAKACVDDGRWQTPEDIRSWVSSAAREDLFAMLPFVAGLLRKPSQQDALFDALLEKDLELYCRALTMRANVQAEIPATQWAAWCMQQLYKGYVKLVTYHFPSFADYIEPWCFMDDGAAVTAVLHADFHPPGLTYYFDVDVPVEGGVFLEVDETSTTPPGVPVEDDIPYQGGEEEMLPDGAVAVLGSTHYRQDGRKVRNIDLARTFTRPGSTRLIAAKLVFNNIREVFQERRILVPWFVREIFVKGVFQAEREGSLRAWLRHTVRQIVALAYRVLDGQSNFAERTKTEVRFDDNGGVDDLRRILILGQWLMATGFQEVCLVDLILPGPECIDDKILPYTTEGRVARVEALCRAVAESYKFICEALSEQARSNFFFAQWPCRAVAEIEMIEGEREPGLSLLWEPCESWDEPPRVSVVRGRSLLMWEDHVTRRGRARQQCLRMGRPFKGLPARSGNGYWWFLEDAVTKFTNDLILADINTMEALFKHGM